MEVPAVILVTGGRGFVGSATVPGLNRDVVAPTSDELDLAESDAVTEYFAMTQPEVVVHLAARVGGITVNLSQPADFLLENVRMDVNVLSAAARHQPRHLVLMLSTCMYPDRLPDSAYPMKEDQIEDGPPPPSNAAYAAAKRTLLHGARSLHDQYGVQYTALVPSNLYGPGDHFGSEASHFLAAAITKIEAARRAGASSVEFFGTGRALRQFLLVNDLSSVIARVVDTEPTNQAVNVAPSHNLSIKELAESVARAADFHGEVQFSGVGPDGQYRKDVSTSLLQEVVPDWSEIETSLDYGLRQTIKWYRDNVATR
jgi:GDP-L-fucose synthase